MRLPSAEPPSSGFRDELTPDLADELIGAIKDYLRLEDIARARRVRPRSLKHWLRRGQQLRENGEDVELTEEEQLLQDFAARFLAEEARYQADWIRLLKHQASKGKRTEGIFSFFNLRWPAGGGIGELVEESAATNVAALLADPPAELIQALKESGIVKHLIDADPDEEVIEAELEPPEPAGTADK
jgi:hypothetical protein